MYTNRFRNGVVDLLVDCEKRGQLRQRSSHSIFPNILQDWIKQNEHTINYKSTQQPHYLDNNNSNRPSKLDILIYLMSG